MQLLVPLQRLLQEHDLALTLDPLALRIIPTLPVSFSLVQRCHLVDTLLVLPLDLKLELQLMKHAGDLGSRERRLVFDEICRRRERGGHAETAAVSIDDPCPRLQCRFTHQGWSRSSWPLYPFD